MPEAPKDAGAALRVRDGRDVALLFQGPRRRFPVPRTEATPTLPGDAVIAAPADIRGEEPTLIPSQNTRAALKPAPQPRNEKGVAAMGVRRLGTSPTPGTEKVALLRSKDTVDKIRSAFMRPQKPTGVTRRGAVLAPGSSVPRVSRATAYLDVVAGRVPGSVVPRPTAAGGGDAVAITTTMALPMAATGAPEPAVEIGPARGLHGGGSVPTPETHAPSPRACAEASRDIAGATGAPPALRGA